MLASATHVAPAAACAIFQRPSPAHSITEKETRSTSCRLPRRAR